jgi:hypothetical protein
VERKIIISKDGSHTVAVPELNVTYYPIYGRRKNSRASRKKGNAESEKVSCDWSVVNGQK